MRLENFCFFVGFGQGAAVINLIGTADHRFHPEFPAAFRSKDRIVVRFTQNARFKGKLLGVDFGDKRTGLAISNDMRTLASGITQISVGGMQKTAAAVAQVARERAVVGVVVGLPVNMDGSHGPRAQHAEKFAGLLREALTALAVEIPVVMQDERMTTMAASRYLNETDTKGAKRKGVIDTLSAEIILQNALDKLRFMKEREALNSAPTTTPTDTEEET